MNAVEHKARWAEIWATRLKQLSNDMAIPPPADFPSQNWDELAAAAGAIAVQLIEFKQRLKG